VASPDELILLDGGGRTVVHRRGDVVIRETGPWTPAVHALLRHLEQAGFTAAPRLVGPGLDSGGREMLTFIEGEFIQPGPWSLDGAAALGTLLRDLHRATATFRPPPGAVWFPWHGRDLGGPDDGYGLTAAQRRGFVGQMIEFAICDTAHEADDAAITPETTAHPVALWAMAWRARSAAWMVRHRRLLETALTR